MGEEGLGPVASHVSSGGNGERSDDELLAELLSQIALKWIRDHNNRPLDELGGLTPRQAHQLLYTQIDEPACPLELAYDLSEEGVLSSRFFRNVRLFLATVDEMGGVKATRAGNLPRSFISEIFPRLEMEEWKWQFIEQFKVINESDIWPLHEVRVICEVGGLLLKRKGRFRLTKRAKGFLAGPVGALYRHLFYTYFYRYNIAYRWGWKEYSEIQDFVNFGLYRLGQLCQQWQSPGRITEEIYVKGLQMEREEGPEPYLDLAWEVECLFLRPLKEFGLLEQRRVKTKSILMNHRYRVTMLFNRFLTFNWLS